MSELLSQPDLQGSGADGRPTPNRIEQVIILMADAVWAVVGLVLWIPQIVRVVITTAARLVHSALTRQPKEAIREPIRRVSRFYVDGFLSPGKPRSSTVYGARQLHVGRLLTEAVWFVAVWLLVLRLIRPDAFSVVWQNLTAFAVLSWELWVDGAQFLVARLPESLRGLLQLGTVSSIVLATALVLVLVGGFLLGRRRR